MTVTELSRLRRRLCALQDHIRDTLLAARAREARHFARIAAVTAADTIYHVDRLSEEAIMAWFEAHWPRAWPVELVMEGIEAGETVTFPRGTPVARTRLKCILDPIDGTRGLMYDKRPAWSLAALAPQRGARTNLRDIVVAVMTELPTSKQGRADQLSVVRGGRVVAERIELTGGRRVRFTPQPSRARDCKHGFAALARFFPEGKELTARIEEAMWDELYGLGRHAALVFEDQYLSTGGQLYELAVGHDRVLGDLRPLVFAKLRLDTSLACHPYDICTALILEAAGGIVERPDGRPLAAPLDTTTSVAWMGYANATLARTVRPVLRRLIARHL